MHRLKGAAITEFGQASLPDHGAGEHRAQTQKTSQNGAPSRGTPCARGLPGEPQGRVCGRPERPRRSPAASQDVTAASSSRAVGKGPPAPLPLPRAGRRSACRADPFLL